MFFYKNMNPLEKKRVLNVYLGKDNSRCDPTNNAACLPTIMEYLVCVCSVKYSFGGHFVIVCFQSKIFPFKFISLFS